MLVVGIEYREQVGVHLGKDGWDGQVLTCIKVKITMRIVTNVNEISVNYLI